MSYKNLSFVLTDEIITQINAKLAEIEALLPFLVTLTKAERRALPKITSASAFFVQEAIDAASAAPAFMPPYVSVPELAKDLALFEQLEKVNVPILTLATQIADTTVAAGSEAYVAALSYYNSVKRAAKDGASGAEVISERLRKRFEPEPGEDDEPASPAR